VGGRFHRTGTQVLSWAMVVIGAAALVSAAVRGSGTGAYLLGGLIVAAGAVRLWVERRRRR